jgi:AbrB family looped-hinge helix DNA binding protein
MKQEHVRLADGGRIIIPAEFRRSLGLEVGDDVVLILDGGAIHLMARSEAVRRAQAMAAQYLVSSPSLSTELIQERREEAADE